VPKEYIFQEEWFRSVGALVSDESEQESLPIVYTVGYDEELIGVREVKSSGTPENVEKVAFNSDF